MRLRPFFLSVTHQFNVPPNSRMDGGPVHVTRNQSSHSRRTGFRILRPNRATRKIPTQERNMARPSLPVVPKEPQTLATAVRNQGFGLVVMIRPLRGVVYVFRSTVRCMLL